MAGSKKNRVKRGQTQSTSGGGYSYDAVQQKTRVVIPDDLISGILMRLPARSVGRFRCVSRSFLSITKNSSFIIAHTQHQRIVHQSLMIEGLGGEVPDWIESLYLASANTNDDTDITLRKLPQIKILNDRLLLKSCDGLILFLSRESKLHCIINPLTGHTINLSPRLGNFRKFFGFYFHHSTSTYRLLCDVKPDKTDVFVVDESKWRRIKSRRPASLKDYHSVDVNGSLHWLAFKECQNIFHRVKSPPEFVMTFDKETEVYGLLPLPPLEKLGDRGGNLMDFNGKLGFWVVSDIGIIDFWIIKECWIKMYSIKHPDLEGCPSSINIWQLGFAVSINDEELLIGISASVQLQYLVRWNLKSGTCLVQNVKDYRLNLYILFPYTETLVEHVFNSLHPCTHSCSQRSII